MNTIQIAQIATRRSAKRVAALSAVLGLMAGGVPSFADTPAAMAPPIQTDAAPSAGAADSVFNWREVPANQEVPVTRASFDQGGYQIYDSVGETIIVPFVNQNLYVMKFAESTNGKMYFVNDGDAPVLYVPANGYLENATTPGARWYPLGKNFHPDHPVFLGVAPKWSVFISMGWYPHMACYGGYWSNTSFVAGGVFLPSVGLFFEIGGHPYYGWGGYHRYYLDHPTHYHIAYFRHDYYHWADRPHASFHQFEGGGHSYFAHQRFAGGDHAVGGHAFHGISGGDGHVGGEGAHHGDGGFRGAGGDHGNWGGGRDGGDGRRGDR